jgi:hypothetical protein
MDADEQMSSPSADAEEQRGLISRVVPPAVRLWIQTQLDQVEALEFRLNGRDRQILSGYVPAVFLSAQKAVYRGLHLSEAIVEAREIRMNLGQVVRGKPLRLLQKFPITGDVVLNQADLNASLSSSLLQSGLRDLLKALVAAQSHDHPLAEALLTEGNLQGQQVAIAPDRITLMLITPNQDPLTLETGLDIDQGRILRLLQPTLIAAPAGDHQTFNLESFEIDLGPEVQIETLAVTSGQIEIRGTVQVVPGD